MAELFRENQIIKVVPEDVEQACSMEIVACSEEELTVACENNLNVGSGDAEFFSVVDGGIIYFASKLEQCGDKQYKVALPPSNKILQRREYSRVKYTATVVLKNGNSEIEVLTTDLSAGGMQIVTKNELAMSEDYNCELELDKNKFISVQFTPIRQDKAPNGGYIVSGKFKELSNKSRISLVQFCFKTQMENTNK